MTSGSEQGTAAFARSTERVARGIVLIVGFLEQAGVRVEALHVSLWAIPTAVVAFLVHGARLAMFDRAVRKDMTASETADQTEAGR